MSAPTKQCRRQGICTTLLQRVGGKGEVVSAQLTNMNIVCKHFQRGSIWWMQLFKFGIQEKRFVVFGEPRTSWVGRVLGWNTVYSYVLISRWYNMMILIETAKGLVPENTPRLTHSWTIWDIPLKSENKWCNNYLSNSRSKYWKQQITNQTRICKVGLTTCPCSSASRCDRWMPSCSCDGLSPASWL